MLTFPRDTKSHFFNYIKNISFCVPKFYQDIIVCGTETSSTKNWRFLSKMAGEDRKVTFCYISISYLKREIRQVLRPSQGAGLMFLPWKQIKGRGFVQCNTTFRCISNISYSWAQSKVINVRVNFERRLYVRKDITVYNFLHNL